jgi:hypothetical protein
MPSYPLLTFLAALLLALAPLPLRAQAALSPPQAEIQKCEERIASVQRDVLGKYDDALGELQLSLQKAADLEGALIVRSERQRLKTDQSLGEKDYLNEPKALRALQTQNVMKLRELISTLVQESLPRLVEYKRTLTMTGKLDEAVEIRSAIERLQNAHVPIVRPDASTVVLAETLLVAYSGDRARADKTYKGQKVTVRGVLGGYRPDPAEPRNYQLYLTGNAGSGWVQCTLTHADFRFREDKNPVGVITLVVTTKDGEGTVRLLKGQVAEIRGVCSGLDEMVRLDRCELPR